MNRILWFTPLAALALGCGGTPAPGVTYPPGYYIAISGMAFSPVNLDVPPGGTVTVLNRETSMLHSVTSQSAPGAFTPGGVAGITFDTQAFGAGQRTFQIPATAVEGTVIPYYCAPHLQNMVTQNGTITIRAAAQAGQPPGGGGTGGGGY